MLTQPVSSRQAGMGSRNDPSLDLRHGPRWHIVLGFNLHMCRWENVG